MQYMGQDRQVEPKTSFAKIIMKINLWLVPYFCLFGLAGSRSATLSPRWLLKVCDRKVAWNWQKTFRLWKQVVHIYDFTSARHQGKSTRCESESARAWFHDLMFSKNCNSLKKGLELFTTYFTTERATSLANWWLAIMVSPAQNISNFC